MAAKTREELLDLIPAYAIGALDHDERIEFEAWLRKDPEAQAVLAEYQAVADHLVTLAPLRAAPGHLQADLRQRLAASSPRPDPAATPLKPPQANRNPFTRQISWVLAAAAVLAVVVFIGVIVVQMRSDEPDETPTAEQLYAQLAAQPGSAHYDVVPGEVDDAVSGNLLVSSDGTHAVLRVASLPTITSEQTFQMWLIDDAGARTSAGLFQAVTAENALYIEVPFEHPVTAYQGVGVSLEPAGGSPYDDKPTGPRVLSVPLG